MHFPEVAEHVDTGTVLAATGPQEGQAFPAGTDVPFMDAVVQALQFAPHDLSIGPPSTRARPWRRHDARVRSSDLNA